MPLVSISLKKRKSRAVHFSCKNSKAHFQR